MNLSNTTIYLCGKYTPLRTTQRNGAVFPSLFGVCGVAPGPLRFPSIWISTVIFLLPDVSERVLLWWLGIPAHARVSIYGLIGVTKIICPSGDIQTLAWWCICNRKRKGLYACIKADQMEYHIYINRSIYTLGRLFSNQLLIVAIERQWVFFFCSIILIKVLVWFMEAN